MDIYVTPPKNIINFKETISRLLQQLWEQKLTWDEPGDVGTEKAMRARLEKLPHLFYIKIPRWVGLSTNHMQHASLHTLSDASNKAFAGVVFLRIVQDDYVTVYFMAAKARVAPAPKLTIPRLELLAADHFWSDSTTVISWIKRQEPWGTFVWNRVVEIRSLTNPENWHHVPGGSRESSGSTFTMMLSQAVTGIKMVGRSQVAVRRNKRVAE
ncbi:hypothetical protein NQ315_008959 [Exocentrus adspersus]|uniref:Uncharacterized protein n=1 Tax=Exocentrus adspersus TaxID=1586481 RepID=A0AAV8VID3_9CUCU|nr:hypothetical protein NQ315_008959 [Exocentrus adspersus]